VIEPTATVPLGRTAIKVCRLGFGSAPLGGLLRETSESDAAEAVLAAFEAGLTYFDTAPQYGGGLAERRLGQALRARPRESFVLSSKVGKLVKLSGSGEIATTGPFVGAPVHEIVYDYSYDGALRSVEASLQRLATDRVDILLIHDVNRKYHGERVMERFEEARAGACKALRRLREEGVIGAFGSALNEVDVSLRFVREADVDCIMLPQRYTLLDRSAEAELLPLCADRGVSVLLAGPFDSGILATGSARGGTYNYQPATPEVMQKVKRFESLCARFDVPLRAAALRFPLRHPAVASVVTGMRSRREVEENVAAMRVTIPEAFWSALETTAEHAE
jgi:D-threo-aldose 1-dehydrogenase